MNLKTAWFVIGMGTALLIAAWADRLDPGSGGMAFQTMASVVKVIAHLHG